MEVRSNDRSRLVKVALNVASVALLTAFAAPSYAVTKPGVAKPTVTAAGRAAPPTVRPPLKRPPPPVVVVPPCKRSGPGGISRC
jgi:hypothetical protein